VPPSDAEREAMAGPLNREKRAARAYLEGSRITFRRCKGRKTQREYPGKGGSECAVGWGWVGLLGLNKKERASLPLSKDKRRKGLGGPTCPS